MKKNVEILKYVTINNAIKLQQNQKSLSLNKADTILYEQLVVKDLPPEKQMQSSTYRKRKSRLNEKLLKAIIASDNEKYLKSTYDKLYSKCLRNILLANFLYLNYARKVANSLLERNVSLARKYHFTDVMINSVRLLRYHAAFGDNKKKFVYYNELLENSLKIIESELKIESISQQLILEVHHSATPNEAQKRKFTRLYKEIARLSLKFPSRSNMLNYFRFGIRLMEYVQNHHQVLQICNKADKYLTLNKHLVQNVRLGEFALYKMGSCLQLGDLESGRECARKCESIFQSGSDNWFIYLEWYFLLIMHNKQYEEAIEVLKMIKQHTRLQNQQQVRIEKWRIYEAYLHFVLPSDKLNRFNLYKFLNDVPLHSKDKSGFNVSILIAQIISLINAGRFDDIVEKDDALKIYCQRYIRLKDNSRTYYFMKMLQVMIKYSFDADKTEQIAQKYFNHLRDPRQVGKSLEELEVIPFDVLWIAILEKLKEAEQDLR